VKTLLIVKTLFAADGVVTPSCSKSHITYTLHLHAPVDELVVDFAYEPKTLDDEMKAKALIDEGLQNYMLPEHLEASQTNWRAYLPLQNLLTLSFDDENGFRGAGHRHDPVQRLKIASEEASPGLIPGQLPRGQFRVTISLHCVVSEQVRYSLRIVERGQDE
jgi:hypothetical protein